MTSARFRSISVFVGLSTAAAFSSSQRSHRNTICSSHVQQYSRRQTTRHPTNVPNQKTLPLFMKTDPTNDDNETDEEDWRKFRMNLINSYSSSGMASGATSVDGIDLFDESADASIGTKEKERPKSVSKRNEELLMSQSELLGEEYLRGVWAHESAVAEVGGLVCRMPLEIELNNPSCSLYYRFQVYLDSQQNVSHEDSVSLGSRYEAAKQFLQSELQEITSTANANGKIDPQDLDQQSVDLLQLYLEQQQEWQHVCLVVEKDERAGTAKTIAINRPMSFKLSESLARLVLLGAVQATQVEKREQNGSDTQLLVKFLAAFENECGVYVGGPHNMEDPAVMIHGIPDIPGAVEISRGTGVYMGGIEAACDGVLSGKYNALDFRFFIGHTSYKRRELDDAVEVGKYQPVACSRPLVLKQCIQLPKPLWHEVLEFCGGELKEISKLELMKRTDIDIEQ